MANAGECSPCDNEIPRQLEGQDLKVKSIPLSRSLNIPVLFPGSGHAYSDLLPDVTDRKAPPTSPRPY